MKNMFLFSKRYIRRHFILFHFRLPKWIGRVIIAPFIVETFTKNESVTATQRAFRVLFRLRRHDPVPTRNTILSRVTNLRATGSALKRK